MARKDLLFTAEAGRDKGKVYKITEMPASQGERWAIRLFFALGKAGIETPEDIASKGMAGLFAIGLMALPLIAFEDAEPLLEEMMACVHRVESAVTRQLVEDDIEEISTRLSLRKATFELHVGFFASAAPSTSESGQAAAQTGNTLNIKMPRKQ